MINGPAIRTLPLRAGIGEGESADSWIEELARRHRVAPRALLVMVGLAQPPVFISGLLYGVAPQLWRHVERATGLAAGRLDSAVGDSSRTVLRLRPGGSRYCPRCLADTHGRWQLSWRLNWTVACRQHRVLLHDTCPVCRAPPRRKVPGGVNAIPPATCTHSRGPSRRTRCGADLTTAAVIPVTNDVLNVQVWIEELVTALGQPDRQHATTVLTDLPLVVSWLLLDNRDRLYAAASGLNPDRPTNQGGQRRSYATIDAALTAAALIHVKAILDGSDQAAIIAVRPVLSGLPTRTRIPPPGMSASHWQALSTRFRNRYLRAADPDLLATERLRMRTVTPAARDPGIEVGRRVQTIPPTEVGGRVQTIPQMLWPDWSARLLPVAGFRPELFRAAFSICLLIPGNPDRDLSALTTRLNPRVRRIKITQMLTDLMDEFGHPSLCRVLTMLCRITDYLDQVGSPIDYQHRREHVPAETISWPRWRDLACSVGAHPGDSGPAGRLLLAQRHLHQLITGADLADPRHSLAFRGVSDRSRYVVFTASLTKPLRQALKDRATELLTDLGIDEPLNWSPPASLADGLDLPGIDTDTLDMATIARLIVDEHRPVSEAARALGVHSEHVRLALERLDRPHRQWTQGATPVAWLVEQRAARLFTRDFFDREYIHKRRNLRELAEDTGIRRHIIARFAKRAGVTLNSKNRLLVDPDWLREQYCERLRSTIDIAVGLGVDQQTVSNALHRLGIPVRPQGVTSVQQMIRVLDEEVPPDIRAAVEGTLHGWLRLHRFQIAMAFPSVLTAASYLGAARSVLSAEFQRLEHDIGEPLFHRSTFRKPHRPNQRGQSLLLDLEHDHIQALMRAALPDHQFRPMPEAIALAEAESQAITKLRKSAPRELVPHDTAPPAGSVDIVAYRLRISHPVLTLLRDLIDHPGELYGLEIFDRTGIDQGTLYPMLHRLHRAGWLTSRPEDEESWLAGAPPGRGPGRRRSYYNLTDSGRRAALYELDRHNFRTGRMSKPVTTPERSG